MEGCDNTYIIRPAIAADLARIIALLADDPIGSTREDPLVPEAYGATFAALKDDPATHLLVAADAGDNVIGYLQMTVTRHLSYRGARRALLEDLRVSASHRRQGIGRRLVTAATAEARKAGCSIIQLFVHRDRDRARLFYQGLGFQADHLGLRFMLS